MQQFMCSHFWTILQCKAKEKEKGYSNVYSYSGVYIYTAPRNLILDSPLLDDWHDAKDEHK